MATETIIDARIAGAPSDAATSNARERGAVP